MDSFFGRTNVVAAAAISFLALLGTRFFNRRSKSHQENKTRASSPSLTLLAPPSSLPHNWKHQVFPSFHGADVRTNFLSHIIKEFKTKGIDLFIDNNIERSKSIGPELIEAIKGSRIAIVLLSKNYASSTWCLNELVEIIKCREELDQTVMPIFYQVDPTDVKKQTGDFGKVFRKTCKAKTEEEIRRWKRALTEVAQIAGYHPTNGETEAEMIAAIATDVSNKLNLSAPCSDFDSLVGMESHMTDIEPLLQLDSSNEVRKIGIWGPPGIGKTTIARSLFKRHSQEFQLSVFMDNIRRKYARPPCSDDYSVKLYLQKEFMSQLTNDTCVSVSHLGVVQDRMQDKKVLVVLDDVDHLEQVEAMAKETYWFGPGSRIIIATQDQRVLRASGINHIHRVNLPSYQEALQMFCIYAFGQNWCKDGFTDLASEVISLVGKLPLGLQVIGSYFRGMSEKDWTEELPRLRTHLEIDGKISSILKFSYDALRNEEKKLFLHIACFFNGERVDIVEGCLAKCFLDVKHGLRVLAEKSLIISIGGIEERIEMAKLLVQLGRKIVREESISEPGKRQFLHDAIDIDEVLSDDKSDGRNVIGIYLNEDIACTCERAFEILSNLQFLRIHGNGVNTQSMNYISQKLRVLAWQDFKMTCFPSSFNPKILVKLEMQNSELEKLWEESKPLNNLKWMDLSESKNLEELSDLSTATNLQELNLSHCSRLVKLPSSIGNINLQKLNLSHCSSLVELPLMIGNAINLIEMNLSYCSSLVELPLSIGNAINLQKLHLDNCSSLVEIPFSMRNLSKLWFLCLLGCSRLEVNLVNINLESVNSLNLSDCYLLKSSPESTTEIQELDPWIGRVSRLRDLNICGMKNLVSLPQLPDSLLFLDASNCESMERLDCSFRNHIDLNFSNCFKLNQEAKDLIIHMQTSGYALFPGTEVPMCFTYRSYGSSLTVKLNQKPLGTSTNFKVCICVGEDYHYSHSKYFCFCCTVTSGGKALTSRDKHVHGVYRGNLCTFVVEVKTEKVTSTELVFTFEAIDTDYEHWHIKECGVLQLMEVPLLSSTDVEDFEYISRSRRLCILRKPMKERLEELI